MRTFQEILEDAGYESAFYSGRGMSGEQCPSITIEGNSSAKLGSVFADVVLAMLPEERLLCVASFRKMREDSLGRDTVIYFPGVPFAE